MDITTLMNRTLARALIKARGPAVMPGAVYQDYSPLLAVNKGDTVNVPIYADVGVINITPGYTPPNGTAADINVGSTAIKVDKWKGSKLLILTDQDLTKIVASETYLPMEIQTAAVELVEDANAEIFKAMRLGTYNAIGTVGTTPFTDTASTAETGLKSATAAMKFADQNKFGRNRNFVMGYDEKANYMGTSAFTAAQEIGTNQNRLSGQFATDAYGFHLLADGQVPTHTNGSATGITTATVNAAGQTTMVLKVASGTGVLTLGTVITVAGVNTKFVIVGIPGANNTVGTADYTLNTTGVAVNVSPALPVTVDGSSTPVAVTVYGGAGVTYQCNFIFQKEAIAWVSRKMTDLNPTTNGLELPKARTSVTLADDLTGLVMRLSLFDQYMQYAWQLDMLYGTKVVDPRYIARYVGATF